MTGPIVFISRSKVRDGGLEGFEQAFREMLPLIEQGKPRTVVFLAYTDEDAGEVQIVHVFPDAEAMDRHLEGVADRAARALGFIQTLGYEILGSPSERTLQAMRGFASELGVPLTIRPHHLGGFLRPSPGDA